MLKAIEEKRVSGEIGSSLEAELTLGVNQENSFLKGVRDSLPEIFIVSAVFLEENPEAYIRVSKAQGAKCPRCWNYAQEIGKNVTYPDICPKCISALVD